MRAYAMGNDRPAPLPEDADDYDGPLSSLEAERTLRWLQGQTLDDREKVFGGGEWIVRCWFLRSTDSPWRLEYAYLDPVTPPALRFGIFILAGAIGQLIDDKSGPQKVPGNGILRSPVTETF